MGFSHIGLATHDMTATVALYRDLLGFPIVAEQQVDATGGGDIRMTYFDVGEDAYIVFMAARGVPEIPDTFDTSINGPAGVPPGLYHFAFAAASLKELKERREALAGAGLDVSDIVDHDYAQSFYFADPNGIQLEFSWQSRPFSQADIGQTATVTVTNSGAE